MTAPADDPSTAALLDGRYLLGECVGQGGMSRVYRAEDVVLGRTVAIKMMRGEADGAAVPPRAQTEMALLASLNHPSLVTLYDANVVPGEPEYLVMEYVEGTTLAAELADHPMDAAELAPLAAELASALHVVHEAGIVHRDVKPSNVLLAADPIPGRRHRAKLADFGVAYLAEGDRLTSPGVVIGTAAYLAPEQVRGEPATPAADIYALGLVFLEALTGIRAFPQASGIGAIMARLVEAPDVPSWLGWEWSTLLQAMTATDPAERPTALDVMRSVAAAPTDIQRPAEAFDNTVMAETAPLVPPLPVIPAAIAAAAEPTVALSASTTRRSRRTTPARGRMRTRTKVLIGSALAVAAIIGTNAATWVGSLPGGPAMVVPTEIAPTTPTEAESDVEPLVLPAGDETAESDTGASDEKESADRTSEPVKTSTEKQGKTGKGGPDKAAKDAAKAERDAAKQKREEEKAAGRQEREGKKGERERARKDRKAERDEKKKDERRERGQVTSQAPDPRSASLA